MNEYINKLLDDIGIQTKCNKIMLNKIEINQTTLTTVENK